MNVSSPPAMQSDDREAKSVEKPLDRSPNLRMLLTCSCLSMSYQNRMKSGSLSAFSLCLIFLMRFFSLRASFSFLTRSRQSSMPCRRFISSSMNFLCSLASLFSSSSKTFRAAAWLSALNLRASMIWAQSHSSQPILRSPAGSARKQPSSSSSLRMSPLSPSRVSLAFLLAMIFLPASFWFLTQSSFCNFLLSASSSLRLCLASSRCVTISYAFRFFWYLSRLLLRSSLSFSSCSSLMAETTERPTRIYMRGRTSRSKSKRSPRSICTPKSRPLSRGLNSGQGASSTQQSRGNSRQLAAWRSSMVAKTLKSSCSGSSQYSSSALSRYFFLGSRALGTAQKPY